MPFIPTLQFQQKQKALLQKKTTGEIDEIGYHRLLDELISEEVHAQQDTVLELAIQEMRETAVRSLQAHEQEQRETQEEIERANQAAARAQEDQNRLEKEGRQQREQDQQRLQVEEAERQRHARSAYRIRIVPGEIAYLKSKYESAKNRYNLLQIASIVFSITTTTLVGTDIFPRWFVLVCSGTAAMAATLLSTFRMREHNYSYYQAISYMEAEIHDYDQRVGAYAGLDDEQAYRRFAARISEIKQQYISQELAMWKAEPSEDSKGAKAPSSSSQIEEDKNREDGKSEQAPLITGAKEAEKTA